MSSQRKPIRTVLIGRGHGAKLCFAALFNSPYVERYPILGVVTDITHPVCYAVHDLAKHMDWNLFIGDVNSAEGLQWLDSLKPDLAIMAGYPKKLTKDVIDRFSQFILNIHPSDLPKHRGPYPLQQQMIENDPLVITVHKIEAHFDAGPWIHKTAPLDISYLVNEEVYGLMKQQAVLSLLATLEKLTNQPDVEFHQQNDSLASYAIGVNTIKLLEKIDWQNEIDENYNIIRAAGTHAGIFTDLQIQDEPVIKVKIHSAYVIYQLHNYPLGKLLSYGNKTYKVAAKNGFLIIDDLRSSQGEPLPPSHFTANALKNFVFQ